MDKQDPQQLPSAPELGATNKLTDKPDSAVVVAPQAQIEQPELVDVEASTDDTLDTENKQYDPTRGDYVEHLNDTTPPPLERHTELPQTEMRKKKHGGLVFLLILIIVLAAGAYYWFGMRTKTAAPAKPKTTTSQTQSQPKKTVVPTKITTKHYDSTNFAMGLDYPDTWKVNDTQTLLSILSPQMSFTAVGGKQVSGYVYVTIQPKQTSLPDFAKGSATAALESQKITYKSPTQNQRAQTYITFASYATTASNGWDAMYITGDNGYQTGQDIPMSDIVQTDPLVTVRFLSCANTSCTGTTTPYSLQATDWKDSALSAPIITLLESFSFD